MQVCLLKATPDLVRSVRLNAADPKERSSARRTARYGLFMIF